VLPALDIHGVAVRTYEDWIARLRHNHFPSLPRRYSDETPTPVSRLKKHPVMLRAIDRYIERMAQEFHKSFTQTGEDDAMRAMIDRAWEKTHGRPLSHRVFAMQRWAQEEPKGLSTVARHRLERLTHTGIERSRDVIGAWSELLTDRVFLSAVTDALAPGAFTPRELERIVEWCAARCSTAILENEEHEQAEQNRPESKRSRRETDAENDADDDDGPVQAIDGGAVEEAARLDREDDTLLLRFHQGLRGPLLRPNGKDALVYEHVLIDEAQDLSPVELGVVLGTVSKAQSVTLAGDVAQRLHMNNGFSNWQGVLGELGLSHVAIEPLKLSYRSTAEIVKLGRAVLGPLADPEAPEVTRHGAPVELFRFADSGDAVGFLAEALRELIQSEPRAAVAVITRFPEHADIYYEGLKKAEVPYLRRIADQDFPFRPGIDVTDVRQVKGLEFDYVILAEVTQSTYGEDDESRHLLHIAATRSSHQLWILASGPPSKLLPQDLQDRGY
jgi:DNA helicase-2/ATP-dependent DNA helicase PcrA